MSTRRIRTVTNEQWNVSTMFGGDEPGYKLSVFKLTNGKFQYGDANGRRFATSEEADSFCLERGYLKRHVIPWCPKCRKLHIRSRRRSAWCDAAGTVVFSMNGGAGCEHSTAAHDVHRSLPVV